MDAKIKELLTRLSFFAEDGMADKPIVEIAKQADALLLEEARKPNTQQPVAYRWRFGSESLDTRWHYSDVPLVPYSDRTVESLYTAQPVPRDVLMAFGEEVWSHGRHACRMPDLAAIADRYASKVQPEPVNQQLQDVAQRLRNAGATLPAPPPGGAIESAMNHGLCIALALVEEAVAATDAAQPVNQQLLAALKQMVGYVFGDIEAGKSDVCDQLRAIIAAAEAAQPVGRHSDDAAVDRFAVAMKHKLEIAREKGRSGWDDPAKCSVEFLAELLCGHIGKGNAGTFEDVANFAMMLHQRGAEPSVLQEAAHQFWKDHRFTVAERHAVEQALAQQPASAQPVAVPDDELEDMARYEFERAMNYGVSLDNFQRLAEAVSRAMLSAAQKGGAA